MSDFFKEEKKKLENFNHEVKADFDKHKKKTTYYRNIKTGKIITSQEYQNLFLDKELDLTTGLSTNGLVGMTPIIEEETLNVETDYVPYTPKEEE